MNVSIKCDAVRNLKSLKYQILVSSYEFLEVGYLELENSFWTGNIHKVEFKRKWDEIPKVILV
jgi:hypothetical protein